MLFVHRADRADLLGEALADLLARPLDDPMVPELVSVPTRGVERWLAQSLASRLGARRGAADGVCANVEFPFPGVLVNSATAQACGLDPAADPWAPERSVWPLIELVDEHLDEPFLAPLARHLRSISAAGERTRRFPTVRRLADLYDRYAVNRPELLESWALGEAGWGAGGDESEAWQAELWRRLRARIGSPGPAERSADAAARLEADPGLVELPERLSLFGITRLPASHLRILRALGAGRDVHLFLLHPSAALWEAVASALPQPPSSLRRSLRRAEDPTAGLVGNPLLRSWGRDARETQLVLAAQGVTSTAHRGVEDASGTLLARIQADIRADRVPGSIREPRSTQEPSSIRESRELPLLEAGDDSLQVHACHGRARQVEVLRDAVLHLLERDPTLEARDVIVMCPDIESFAPLVAASFGTAAAGELGETSPPPPTSPTSPSRDGLPPLRVRLADRSIRQTNPLLAVAARLLELAGGRATASEVLDLAASEPVARRFDLGDDDLAQIGRWVAETGIRWGIDAGRRAAWGLAEEPSNTWRFGLDRLLLGAAMSEEGLRRVGGVLPFDDVSNGAVDLVGRFAELVERLGTALDRLGGRQPVAGWADSLAEAAESLAVAAPQESWQHLQLRGVLDELAGQAASGSPAIELDLVEVTSLLDERLRGRPTRANFRTGDLTVCTLVPMRSVPHRVVCLLGLDDGVFPRQSLHEGDNLLLADPRVGERDPRSEDRQLLLDALLAAKDHLIVTYEGHDLRTNQLRPPCVPVAELLDVVDQTVRLDEPGERPRGRVVVLHPLQPFDPRNYGPAQLGTAGPFSFDRLNLQGARALCGERSERPPFLSGPLDATARPVLALDSLVRFFEHPVRAFLRERLSLSAGGDLDVVKDDISIDLDPLERWEIGDRLLAARLDGLTSEVACAAERARGLLPPGQLAEVALGEIVPVVDALAAELEATGRAAVAPESVPVQVALSGGRLLVGAVGGVRGDTVVRVVYSKLGAKHRIAAWIAFLALTASEPDRRIGSVTIGQGRGRPGGSPRVAVSELPPLDDEPPAAAKRASELLEDLVELYERGLREPLPLFCETSSAWAEAVAAGEEAAGGGSDEAAAGGGGGDEAVEAAARSRWETAYGAPPGEGRDPSHLRVLGGEVPFATLLAASPAPGEDGPGWAVDEATRFGRLARRLWDPVLAHERRSLR